MTAHHRFFLDSDGSNLFQNAYDADVARGIDMAARECAPNVTTVLLCSGAGTFYYPTKVGKVSPRCTMLVEAHRRGVDPFGMQIDAYKAAGKEVMITFRMNDVHNPDDANAWNTPPIRQRHPDCIVGAAEIAAGKGQWMSYCLDYARPEVQRYMLDVIAEQLDLYGDRIDGFQLDWMRFPRHLAGTPERVWEQRDIITGFMADVRRLSNKVIWSARVPAWVEGCRHLGFDLAEWGRRKLIDMLVACPFLTTHPHVPVSDFRALLGDVAIPVYAGFDFGFGRQHHHPESLRATCAALYEDQPDGIYLFNFPCWTEYLAARPYHWLEGLDKPATAGRKPMLFFAPHQRHRIAGVDPPGCVPVTIPPGQSMSVTLRLPRTAFPLWRAIALLHSHGDVELTVNGRRAFPQVFRQPDNQPSHRSEIFLEFADHLFDRTARPDPMNCRSFLVDCDTLQPGENTFRITNPGHAPLEIERVNLGVW